jgi:tetratricopeptide (TPR) repeat protein
MASAKPPAGIPGAEKKSMPLEGELPARDPGDQKAETIPGPGVKTAPEPAVPPELIGLAREAKDQFERGNYREAEKIYQKALAKAPNNLYILSNQGVVYFRGQKYKLAEEAFKKAIAIAPEDDFSHCTLGIVYYSQGKLDEAINELTKALAINPKNATAHNYLGITASQKGWQEAAMKELETATALDPNYADAHFNLAVVFATITPPNKEGARQHYKRATELGAEPDSALEQMLK